MPAEPRELDLTPVYAADDNTILTGDALEEALWRVYRGDEIFELPQTSYLLDQWIPRAALTIVTAHGGSGKSLLGFAWAQCIARGVPWSGRDVLNPGPVLYITQEGMGGVGPRVRAWMLHRHFDTNTNDFLLLPAPARLGASTDFAGTAEMGVDWERVLDMIEEYDPVAVVLDPFADYFRPGAENSNDDVREWASFVRTHILNRPNAPAMIVMAQSHNETKGEDGTTGPTALYDAADRMYTITTHFPVEDKSGGYSSETNPVALKLSTVKAKDGRRPGTWLAKFVEVEVGEDEKGEPVTSVTLDGCSPEEYFMLTNASAQSRRTGNVESWEDRVVDAVKSYGAATLDEIKDALPKIKDSTLRASLSTAKSSGRLVNPERGVYAVPSADEPDEL